MLESEQQRQPLLAPSPTSTTIHIPAEFVQQKTHEHHHGPSKKKWLLAGALAGSLLAVGALLGATVFHPHQRHPHHRPHPHHGHPHDPNGPIAVEAIDWSGRTHYNLYTCPELKPSCQVYNWFGFQLPSSPDFLDLPLIRLNHFLFQKDPVNQQQILLSGDLARGAYVNDHAAANLWLHTYGSKSNAAEIQVKPGSKKGTLQFQTSKGVLLQWPLHDGTLSYRVQKVDQPMPAGTQWAQEFYVVPAETNEEEPVLSQLMEPMAVV